MPASVCFCSVLNQLLSTVSTRHLTARDSSFACSAAAIISKIGLDQMIMAPVGTILFFSITKLLDGFQTAAVVPTVQARPSPLAVCIRSSLCTRRSSGGLHTCDEIDRRLVLELHLPLCLWARLHFVFVQHHWHAQPLPMLARVQHTAQERAEWWQVLCLPWSEACQAAPTAWPEQGPRYEYQLGSQGLQENQSADSKSVSAAGKAGAHSAGQLQALAPGAQHQLCLCALLPAHPLHQHRGSESQRSI